MSTLAEIEQAAQVLPLDQRQKLVAFLLTGLRKDGGSWPPPNQPQAPLAPCLSMPQ